MKLKFRNAFLVSFLAIASFFGVGSTLINKQVNEQPVVEKAQAADAIYTLIGGHNQWAQVDFDDIELTDSDGDGVYSTTITFQANDEWKIRQDYAWDNQWARGCLASYPTGSFWGTGEYESDSNIHVVTGGTYRVDFTPSLGSIEVWSTSGTASLKTFRLLIPSTWNDWADNVRVHWWGSSTYDSNYRAGKKLVNSGQSYTTGSVSGTIYTTNILADATGVQVLKADVSAQTTGLTISGSDDFAAYLSYSGTNDLTSFTYIPDGGYLRGVYQGADEQWSSNIDLVAGDYVTWDSAQNKYSARLTLNAGDYFKFVRVLSGVEYWNTTYDIKSSNNYSYPYEWESNNVKVTNAAVYYISAGFGTDSHAGDLWYYLDATAQQFAYTFLNSMTCVSSGASEPTWKETSEGSGEYYSWSYFSTWFGILDDYAKNKLYGATANPSSSDNIEEAVARYYFLIANHGYTPFITNSAGTSIRRAPKNISPLSLMVNDENGLSTIIIIATSSVALLSVTALSILVIKKRKNKEE